MVSFHKQTSSSTSYQSDNSSNSAQQTNTTISKQLHSQSRTKCIQTQLAPAIQRQQEALRERDEKRQWCAERLLELRSNNNTTIHTNTSTAPPSNNKKKSLSQLQQEYDQLQKDLIQIQHQTQRLSIDLTSKQISNDERESNALFSKTQIETAQLTISKVYQECALEGLYDMVSNLSNQNWKLRCNLVLQLFDMFKVQIGDETEKLLLRLSKEQEDSNHDNNKHEQVDTNTDSDTNTKNHSNNSSKTKSSRKPKGYGKIAGLPLPHAGLIYYALFPPIVLTSSLRLVASLTSLIARCYKIDLPHPILTRPNALGTGTAAGNNSSNLRNSPPSNDIIIQEQVEYYDHEEDDEDQAILLDEYDCDFVQTDGISNSSSSSSSAAAATSSYRKLIQSPAATLITKIIPPRFSQLGRRPWSRAAPVPTSTSNTTPPSISFTTSTIKNNNDEVLVSFTHNTNNPPTVHPTTTNSKNPPPNYYFHHYSTKQLISHCTHAILQEKQQTRKKETITTYALLYQPTPDKHSFKQQDSSSKTTSPKTTTATATTTTSTVAEDQFSVGLQLLQNNVVALCIRAGVPVDELWPAEAVLLNLHSLWRYCQSQVQTSNVTRG